jgi:hypothetical protein
MSTCDDVRLLLVFGRVLDASATAHLGACPRCRLDEPVARALGRALAAEAAVEPPPGLSARVLRAAVVPLALQARRAARPDWRAVARAIGAALVPLPLILYLDVRLVRGAYRLLCTVLPGTLSFYLVFNYTTVVALLLTASYAAAPLLAARQGRGRLEERHA